MKTDTDSILNVYGNQRGTTMIEVLVTLFVLAIGLLGIAALQLTSKKSNFESVQRTSASMLVQGLLEKMRANPGYSGAATQPLNSYAGTQETALADIDGAVFPTEPAPDCSSAGTACSDLQLATHDLWEFEQSLIGATSLDTNTNTNTGGLAFPTACITSFVPAAQVITGTATVTRAGRYQITLAWRGQTALSDPDPGNPCGQASGNYDGVVAGDNAHRRLMVVNTVISQTEQDATP